MRRSTGTFRWYIAYDTLDQHSRVRLLWEKQQVLYIDYITYHFTVDSLTIIHKHLPESVHFQWWITGILILQFVSESENYKKGAKVKVLAILFFFFQTHHYHTRWRKAQEHLCIKSHNWLVIKIVTSWLPAGIALLLSLTPFCYIIEVSCIILPCYDLHITPIY